MSLLNALEDAILMAVQAHRGQTHAFGTPYILHPLRVMELVRKSTHEDEMSMVVAVLHDVVEDTGVELSHIANHFGLKVADCVHTLTHAAGASYECYIQTVANSRLSRITIPVKLADLEDNLKLGVEHPLPMDRQVKLTSRYLKAQEYLRRTQ